MNKPDVYISSDYAGLNTDNANFYYGYECTDENDEWCFSAKCAGEETIIPFSKLQAKDQFDVVDCLLIGIGWILTKYQLNIN